MNGDCQLILRDLAFNFTSFRNHQVGFSSSSYFVMTDY